VTDDRSEDEIREALRLFRVLGADDIRILLRLLDSERKRCAELDAKLASAYAHLETREKCSDAWKSRCEALTTALREVERALRSTRLPSQVINDAFQIIDAALAASPEPSGERVHDSACEGGVMLTSEPCPKCGATDDDFCAYAGLDRSKPSPSQETEA
jgi:hypothetical protein